MKQSWNRNRNSSRSQRNTTTNATKKFGLPFPFTLPSPPQPTTATTTKHSICPRILLRFYVGAIKKLLMRVGASEVYYMWKRERERESERGGRGRGHKMARACASVNVAKMFSQWTFLFGPTSSFCYPDKERVLRKLQAVCPTFGNIKSKVSWMIKYIKYVVLYWLLIHSVRNLKS